MNNVPCRAFICIASILGLAAVLPAPGATARKAPPSSYINGSLGFSVNPPDFGEVPAGTSVIPAVFAGPAADGFASNVNVVIQAARTTAQEYHDISLHGFQQAGMKVNKEQQRQVSGKPAWVFDYEGKMNGRPLRFLAQAIIADDRVYLITCTATPAKFPALEAEFQKTLDSFALSPQ